MSPVSGRLQVRQRALLGWLLAHAVHLPLNTHEIARSIGHEQGYEGTLRDRLFRLQWRGLVEHTQKMTRTGRLRERCWSLTTLGRVEAMAAGEWPAKATAEVRRARRPGRSAGGAL